ncbi:MAG TPA: hypothetical protein VFE35_04270 [Candidatus Cybelea sp.]|jgi:hypothetical protein|nr:hypothetical protein [Candidatus Cybelea sp.]
MKRLRTALFVLAMSAYAIPAVAVVMHGHVWQATYVAAYQPTFGAQRVPNSGTLKLKFDHGIVSGTYVSESVRPDPLYGRIVAVSGNVSEGRITLIFQASGGFTVRGTIAGDGEISGTATIRGSFYSFLAKVKSSP